MRTFIMSAVVAAVAALSFAAPSEAGYHGYKSYGHKHHSYGGHYGYKKHYGGHYGGVKIIIRKQYYGYY
jgi:hypothetical protein